MTGAYHAFPDIYFAKSPGEVGLTLRYKFPPLLVPTKDNILIFFLRKTILGISGCWKSKNVCHSAQTIVEPKLEV